MDHTQINTLIHTTHSYMYTHTLTHTHTDTDTHTLTCNRMHGQLENTNYPQDSMHNYFYEHVILLYFNVMATTRMWVAKMVNAVTKRDAVFQNTS